MCGCRHLQRRRQLGSTGPEVGPVTSRTKGCASRAFARLEHIVALQPCVMEAVDLVQMAASEAKLKTLRPATALWCATVAWMAVALEDAGLRSGWVWFRCGLAVGALRSCLLRCRWRQPHTVKR